MKKTLLLIISTVLLLASCASIRQNADAPLPAAIETRIGTFTRDAYGWYECTARKGGRDIALSVAFGSAGTRAELDALLMQLDNIMLRFEETDAEIRPFAAKEVGMDAEEFYIYEITIYSKGMGKKRPIQYTLLSRTDHYADPLMVCCDENGSPVLAMFVD